VRGAHASPTTLDRKKDFGEILDEELLLLGIEHQVAVAVFDVCESGKDAAADTEISGTKVRALFGAGEAEGDAGKVFGSHEGAVYAEGVRGKGGRKAAVIEWKQDAPTTRHEAGASAQARMMYCIRTG